MRVKSCFYATTLNLSQTINSLKIWFQTSPLGATDIERPLLERFFGWEFVFRGKVLDKISERNIIKDTIKI